MPCLNETIITSCLSVMCLLYMLALDVMHAIHRLFYNIKLASQIQYNVTKDISILFGFHSYIGDIHIAFIRCRQYVQIIISAFANPYREFPVCEDVPAIKLEMLVFRLYCS
eukprot:868363_1